MKRKRESEKRESEEREREKKNQVALKNDLVTEDGRKINCAINWLKKRTDVCLRK